MIKMKSRRNTAPKEDERSSARRILLEVCLALIAVLFTLVIARLSMENECAEAGSFGSGRSIDRGGVTVSELVRGASARLSEGERST